MSRHSLFGSVLLLSALVPTQPLPAQRATGSASAESVVRSFFQAVTAEDWRTAAALLDLEAFRPLLRLALEQAQQYRPPQDLTIDDILRHDPDLPREVAAYQLKQIQAEAGRYAADPLGGQFAGVTAAAALAALPLDQAAAAWLEAQDERTALREAFTRKRCPVPSRDSLARLTRHELLGTLLSGDSVAYALHRTVRWFPDSVALMVPGPAVMELRRRGGDWRILPRYDLFQPMDPLLGDLSCERPPARRVRPPG